MHSTLHKLWVATTFSYFFGIFTIHNYACQFTSSYWLLFIFFLIFLFLPYKIIYILPTNTRPWRCYRLLWEDICTSEGAEVSGSIKNRNRTSSTLLACWGNVSVGSLVRSHLVQFGHGIALVKNQTRYSWLCLVLFQLLSGKQSTWKII